MMRSLLYLIFALTLFSCTKEIVVFHQDGKDFEWKSILKFNNKNCVFDNANQTLKYSIEEKGLANFTPYVEFDENAEITLNKTILKNNAVNSLNSFKLNEKYDVKITILNETHYFKLVFKAIPIIHIISNDEILNSTKNIAKLTLTYPEVSKPNEECFIGIEIRGNYSAFLEKKSYSIKPLESLESGKAKKIAFFPSMQANDKWALDAMYKDEAKSRNRTAFKIWESTGKNTIQTKYVEVYINNNYNGLYNLSETYTETYLGLTSKSEMIAGIEHTDLTDFKTLPERKPYSKYWDGWEQKYTPESRKVNWESFYELSKLVIEADDQTFNANIFNCLDLNNVIDYCLYMHLCYGDDNVGKNWHFVKRNDKYQILLWDLDAAWGRGATGGAKSPENEISNRLFTRLINQNTLSFKDQLKDRWKQLRANEYETSKLIAHFKESMEVLLRLDVVEDDNKKWGLNRDIENEQIYIENWISNRTVYLDKYFESL